MARQQRRPTTSQPPTDSPFPIPDSKTGTPLATPVPSSSGSGPMRLLLLVILLAAAPAWAQSYQSVDSIRAAALATVGPDAEAEATLDPG
ncbi:hypothetical protein L2216_13285, partial [Xanthomonas perforans]|nr:hypothetical protein [Xanthomonas perforans]